MKVYPVSTNKNLDKTSFKSIEFPADIQYKKLLIQGLKDTYGVSCKLTDLDSIAGPQEFKHIINNLKSTFYKIGENFRANFHIHTTASDGCLTLQDYLDQCSDWANHIFKNLISKDNLPPFSASITDHDCAENTKRAIAEIAQNPEKYKNFKFVAGCEFLFDGYKKPYSAFEAVGLGFNPFDKDIQPLIAGQRISNNKVSDIPKIKAAGGVLSWAHPAYTRDKINEDFFIFLKKNGIEGAEGDYQYIEWDKDYINSLIPSIKNLMTKHGFFSTGGTDTHRKTIFF